MEAIKNTLRLVVLVLLPIIGCNTDQNQKVGTVSTQHAEVELSPAQREIDSLYAIGKAHYLKSEYDNALEYFSLCQNMGENISDASRTAQALNGVGLTLRKKGVYNEALKNYLKSLKLYEGLNDVVKIAMLYNNIGALYQLQGNNDHAIEFYQKTLSVKGDFKEWSFEENEHAENLANASNNIGMIYVGLERHKEALDYYLKSLKLEEVMGNKKGISASYTNIGNLYRKEGEYRKALNYYSRGLKLKEEIGDREGVARSWMNIGTTKRMQGYYSEALGSINKGLEIAKEVDNGTLITEHYLNLDETFGAMRQFELAYKYSKIHSSLKDSLLNEKITEQMAEMQTKFETEKKEKEIELLNKDKEVQRLEIEKKDANLAKQRIFIWAACGIGLIIAIFAFYVFRSKKLLAVKNEELAEQKKIIEEKNKDITDSIRYAEQIQHALLPSNRYMEELLPDSFVLFKPKDIVSGDFYWATQRGDKVFFAACDCTGHGVPGAFVHMIISTLLNEVIIAKGITDPAEILNEVRIGIIESLTQEDGEYQLKDGMDAMLCVWDKRAGTFEFAGAHNPLLLVRDGEIERIKGDSQPVGYNEFKQNPFTCHSIDFREGDVIYIFSDGFEDQFGGKNDKKFGRKRFNELLLSIQELPTKEQKTALDERIEKWKGGREQVDDILVIGVRA